MLKALVTGSLTDTVAQICYSILLLLYFFSQYFCYLFALLLDFFFWLHIPSLLSFHFSSLFSHSSFSLQFVTFSLSSPVHILFLFLLLNNTSPCTLSLCFFHPLSYSTFFIYFLFTFSYYFSLHFLTPFFLSTSSLSFLPHLLNDFRLLLSLTILSQLFFSIL